MSISIPREDSGKTSMFSRNQWETAGYQIAPEVFSADEIKDLRDAVTETIDRVANAMRAPFAWSFPEAPLEERIDRIAARDRVYALALFRAALADTHRDARVEAIGTHPRLTEIVREILTPLAPDGYTIRVRAAISSLASARSPWHQDVVRETGPCSSVRLACWIPLDDVDAHTGSLEVVPGNWTAPLPHSEDTEGGRFLIRDKDLLHNGDAANRHAVLLRRGDVLLLHRFIPHRSLPVTENRARWAITMWVKGLNPCAPEADGAMMSQ